MNKRIFSLVLVVLFAGALPAFALSDASARALDAFRRYEPDFLSSLKKLQEVQRKIQNQNLKPGTDRFAALKDEADDLMDFVQRRYDLMDDLYKGVSGDYPADRGQLFDGFSRLDDLYRQSREFYMEHFQDGMNRTAPASEKKSRAAPAQPAGAPEKRSAAPAGGPGAPLPGPALTTGAPAPAPEPAPVPKAKASTGKARLTGSLKVDMRNKNEKYTAQNTALPNNQFQSKLSLMYEMDEKNKLYLDEKYLQRKRNELVKENVLTFSWMHKHSPKSTLSFKDTLHHVWYPQNSQKAYRDNLAELFWNKKEGRWERLYNLGFESRKYPEYSRSDFTQWNWSGQNTYFIQNGTLYGESNYNWRSYKNSSNLDYSNFNYYAEFNRSYNGNKSEISISDTYDRRTFGQEAVNLFRASYQDNYFRFRYDLPVSKTWKWTFEDEFQKRVYFSDRPRGYAQLKIKTTGHITIDKNSRAKIGHTYTSNEENTKAKAHKNHQVMGMWEKKFGNNFKLKIEDFYHRRYTIIGDIMDFKENVIAAKAVWRLPSRIELTWRNEYLTRLYTTTFYRDYRYFLTGLTASYAKAKKFDWSIDQGIRKFAYRNGNNVFTGWTTQTQPITEGNFRVFLRDDLRLRLTASREKSYYKSFDTTSQELLWDFTRPITVTEFFGGIEYDF